MPTLPLARSAAGAAAGRAPDMKACTECHSAKVLTEFHRRGDGRQSACRECKSARDIAYYNEDRERAAAKNRAYCQANREQIAERKATRRLANPDEERAREAAWRLANPEKDREKKHRRRVRLRGGFVEAVDIAVLVERDGGYCGICHKRVKKAERSIDHVLPVSRGGAHSYANCRLAHLRCNVLRGNRGVAQLRLSP